MNWVPVASRIKLGGKVSLFYAHLRVEIGRKYDIFSIFSANTQIFRKFMAKNAESRLRKFRGIYDDI